jgi:hypothetical protein
MSPPREPARPFRAAAPTTGRGGLSGDLPPGRQQLPRYDPADKMLPPRKRRRHDPWATVTRDELAFKKYFLWRRDTRTYEH